MPDQNHESGDPHDEFDPLDAAYLAAARMKRVLRALDIVSGPRAELEQAAKAAEARGDHGTAAAVRRFLDVNAVATPHLALPAAPTPNGGGKRRGRPRTTTPPAGGPGSVGCFPRPPLE